MQRHWREVAPPLNVTMAAFVGFKPAARAADERLDGDELSDWLRGAGLMT